VNAIPADTMLVCFAMKEEAGAFQRASKANPDVTILVTGIGKANTEKSVRDSFARRYLRRPDLRICRWTEPGLESGTRGLCDGRQLASDKTVIRGAEAVRFFCAVELQRQFQKNSSCAAVPEQTQSKWNPNSSTRYAGNAGFPAQLSGSFPTPQMMICRWIFNNLANPDLSLNYGSWAWAIAVAPGKIPALMRLQKISASRRKTGQVC
jgi:hypothetical protein